MLENKNYAKYLDKAREIGKKQAFRVGIGHSLLFSIIFGFYGYSFFWGGYLRYNKYENGSSGEYTGGVVLAIMFSVVFGAFSFGGAFPHMASIAEAKVAGKLAFDVIQHRS